MSRVLKIHYLQQFFTGPAAPGPTQPRKLMEALARRGHQVEVVSGDFNAYNEQTEPVEQHSCPGGGRWQVHRLSCARGMRRNLWTRLRSYGGFMVPAYRRGRRMERPDVVVGSIQPLFAGLVASRLAKRAGVPFVLEVRDLWPDALEAKGAVVGWKARGLHALANHLYQSARRIVSLTPGIKVELVRKGIDSRRIDVFTNGCDPQIFELSPDSRERVRKEMGWDGKFVAVYTGTHVEVTAPEVIVRAASVTREREEIIFVMVGQGQRKPAAVELARRLGLSNIQFHDPVPKARIPELLAGADVGLMTLFKSPLIHIYFENKFLDYMAAGKPILAAMDGMQSDLIQRHQVGLTVPSFDHEGLARLVIAAASDFGPFADMGRNGYQLVRRRFLLPEILEHYASMIEAVADDDGDSIAPWEAVV
ncbi:MAG: glycosyltransferase family 4 protein [Verrucomicrobiia bacterium]